MSNKLLGKTIIFNGDSICAGGEVTGNWATRITLNNKMNYKNYAVGGGTVSCGHPELKYGTPRHSVLNTVDEMYKEFPDADYIIFEGGTNDADLISREDSKLTLGSFDMDDFSGEYDLTTFCGALETLFYKAIKYWCGKKIGFIGAHKMGVDANIRNLRRKYLSTAIEICKKWGIPYIDLWEKSYLNPCLPWMLDLKKTQEENILENKCCYADTQHLTALGYDITSKIIEAWLHTI